MEEMTQPKPDVSVLFLPLSFSWRAWRNPVLLFYSPPEPSVASGHPLDVCAPPNEEQ